MDKYKKINAVIIEDEQFSADNLVDALQRVCPYVVVKKICNDINSAISAISEIKPELVFLDVFLNGKLSAFEILSAFENFEFKLIFTTAYEEFALSAFEYNAIYFLLKPYSDEKLAYAVQRAKLISIGEQKENIEGLKITDNFMKQRSDYFAFRNNNGTYSIKNYKDIIFLQADGSYIQVFFIDGTSESTTNKPLTEYENILKHRGFIRISQKHLVNVVFISKYKKVSNKFSLNKKSLKDKTNEGAGGSVILSNGITLPVSRQCYQNLKDILNIV